MAGIFSEWIEEASLQLKKWTNSTHSKALQHWATESSCVSDKLNHWIAFLSVPINSFLFPEPLRVWFLLSVTKRTHYSRFSTISFDNIGIPPKNIYIGIPYYTNFSYPKKSHNLNSGAKYIWIYFWILPSLSYYLLSTWVIK